MFRPSAPPRTRSEAAYAIGFGTDASRSPLNSVWDAGFVADWYQEADDCLSVLKTPSTKTNTVHRLKPCRISMASPGAALAGTPMAKPSLASNTRCLATAAGLRGEIRREDVRWVPIVLSNSSTQTHNVPDIFAIMSFLDCEVAIIDFIKKKLPPSHKRQLPNFWKTQHIDAHIIVQEAGCDEIFHDNPQMHELRSAVELSEDGNSSTNISRCEATEQQQRSAIKYFKIAHCRLPNTSIGNLQRL
ncbi:unnamed protein product [Phytophthora fragariaefolia]|uniref:Unnamed protein product n=1 Tax=Phytophthora fragariaefolia TaxID=1490495 RepID=A0A9W6XP83_9STRA|nr:unnamed protein product [Phytophthora fragariaefolia]